LTWKSCYRRAITVLAPQAAVTDVLFKDRRWMIPEKVGKWKEKEETHWCNPFVSIADMHVLHVLICYEFNIYGIYYCKITSFDSLFRKCTSFLLEN